jgi:molybdopterin synthase catalytic subunit
VHHEKTADHWFALTSDPLSVGEVYDWAVRADCGAVVLFSGTVRDHAEEAGERRDGVTHLEYEAYDEQVLANFRAIADEVRVRWPMVGRIALLHRVGRLELGESSVLAVVSAPHRPEAFTAARFAIDALKAGAPIWKKEEWSGGSSWGTGATVVTEPSAVASLDETSVR